MSGEDKMSVQVVKGVAAMVIHAPRTTTAQRAISCKMSHNKPQAPGAGPSLYYIRAHYGTLPPVAETRESCTAINNNSEVQGLVLVPRYTHTVPRLHIVDAATASKGLRQRGLVVLLIALRLHAPAGEFAGCRLCKCV